MDIKNHKVYKSLFKNPWSYVTGAILLSVFQIITMAATDGAWGVVGPFAVWAAWVYEAVGGSVGKWYFFNLEGTRTALEGTFFSDPSSIRNLGLAFGALLATLLASQFKFKKIKNLRQAAAAIIGGLLMGYGSRIAFGCNIGAFYSGISVLSVSGWVFAVFMYVGAFFGSRLLVKYFM
ncbi:MAG TPA: YeeE/YedE thiosulfate transporter family protein [Candidatus Limnocylindrales bacterium]|nr:YeeE/YedE thiosulfate transporter family protein [Candidatus Limnocylindrales bacterium]